jgi:hypothetical protein
MIHYSHAAQNAQNASLALSIDDDLSKINAITRKIDAMCARDGLTFSSSSSSSSSSTIFEKKKKRLFLGDCAIKKTPSPSLRCVGQQTRDWLAKRKKVVKRTLTDAKRAQLQELFSALDSDGGGEVEFEEFALAWKMMAGDREESATIARRAFKEIDVDGNGTMDFEEFARLMLDLEDGRGAVTSAANDPTCGAMLARSARSLRTRKLVDEFIETFSKNDDKYNAWFNEDDKDDNNDAKGNAENDDREVERNTWMTLSESASSRKPSFLLLDGGGGGGANSEELTRPHRRRNSSIGVVKRKMSLADMCAPEDLLRKIRNNREHERRKTQHQLDVLEQMEKQRRETVKVNMLDQELHEMDELLTKVVRVASRKRAPSIAREKIAM